MRRSRMIFRTLSDRTTVTQRQRFFSLLANVSGCRQTFIFPYVLERKGEASIFALNDAHFAKGALADDAQQPEVVEVHCVVVRSRSFRPRVQAWQAWQAQARCSSRGHDAGLQHTAQRRSQRRTADNYCYGRTLVGEHHGLAITLTHGGLQLGAVRASLVMHPDRQTDGQA